MYIHTLYFQFGTVEVQLFTSVMYGCLNNSITCNIICTCEVVEILVVIKVVVTFLMLISN